MVAGIIFGRVTHKNETADHVPCWVHVLPWVPGAPLAHQIAPPVNSPPPIKATRSHLSLTFFGMHRNAHSASRILAGILQNLKFISASSNRY
ncbi:hypothetical protein OIU84_019277 [Salix udensis]|uniref:Uncharacterized protein n=1 Tax=Salix udensis TaxID=889485 RepID=A0AAD6KZV5_9ROSI|nr:hypothetical protein OIU84_019277 [Salix udensis]